MSLVDSGGAGVTLNLVAYRITATTERDRKLLDEIRDLAWRQRTEVSQVMREAFLHKLYGTTEHWPEEYR